MNFRVRRISFRKISIFWTNLVSYFFMAPCLYYNVVKLWPMFTAKNKLLAKNIPSRATQQLQSKQLFPIHFSIILRRAGLLNQRAHRQWHMSIVVWDCYPLTCLKICLIIKKTSFVNKWFQLLLKILIFLSVNYQMALFVCHIIIEEILQNYSNVTKLTLITLYYLSLFYGSADSQEPLL